MTIDAEITDQRNYKRYKPRKNACVAINSGLLKLGRIINIGQGGLAFCCIDDGKPVIDEYKMDIFLASDWFQLTDIPYKVVSEIQLISNISDESIKLRQCCVVNGHLTHFQNSALDYFIRKYTTNGL